jgi:formamidopyrimidine-DNA glycosylase
MPELPEVEAICRKLRRQLRGAEIVSACVLRCGDPRLEAAVPGRKVLKIFRRGKNILIELSGGLTIRAHMRMTGNLYVIPDGRFRPASTRLYFELVGGRGLIFDDPRALGRVDLHDTALVSELLSRLGPEPLSPAFTPESFICATQHSRQPAKLFLMDQHHVAGLGNIYAAEALFRARINPAKPINRVRRNKLRALHRAIVGVLEDAVQSACIAYSGPGHFEEGESFPLAVYGREGDPCLRCRRKVRRFVQGGRSTYYCPGCQR